MTRLLEFKISEALPNDAVQTTGCQGGRGGEGQLFDWEIPPTRTPDRSHFPFLI
jgi:hypothetical protein